MRNSDIAMYRAKQRAGISIFFEESYEVTSAQPLKELRRAILNTILHYQPR
jgi:hypothetical protein